MISLRWVQKKITMLRAVNMVIFLIMIQLYIVDHSLSAVGKGLMSSILQHVLGSIFFNLNVV